jgi:3-hydroxyacyl-[acyl-carrier-protein] dehydratase
VDSRSVNSVLDGEAIRARIPHRPPFLFVDRAVALEDDGITTEWDVQPDAPFFEGHYPDNPIVPGVLLSEFVFQSAALFMSGLMEGEEGVPVLTKIEDARFRSMVTPGETLRAEVTLTERLGPACYMKAKVTSEGRSVLRIAFVVALAPTEAPA